MSGALNVRSQCKLTTGTLDFRIVGGTSASSPAFAGVMALVNQYQAAHMAERTGKGMRIMCCTAGEEGRSELHIERHSEAAGCIFNDVTMATATCRLAQRRGDKQRAVHRADRRIAA